MEGVNTATICCCDVGSILFIRACHQLLAQGTYLGQIGLKLSFETFCVLLRAGKKNLLLLDKLFSGPNPLFKGLQFLSQSPKGSSPGRCVISGIKSRLLRIKLMTLLGDISL